MLLRASGEQTGQTFETLSVTDDALDSGVPHSQHLRLLTEHTIRGEWQALKRAYASAAEEMGEQGVVDALVVASAFNGITRVADATGIPLDENTQATTGDLRATTGIDHFAYAQKSLRYDQS